jgi:thiol:disulfide interchange protein
MILGGAFFGLIAMVVAWWLIRRLIVLVLILALVFGIAAWAEHASNSASSLPRHALHVRVLQHAEAQSVRRLRRAIHRGRLARFRRGLQVGGLERSTALEEATAEQRPKP